MCLDYLSSKLYTLKFIDLKRIVNEALDALEEIENSNIAADEINKSFVKKRSSEENLKTGSSLDAAEEKHIPKRVLNIAKNQAESDETNNKDRKRSEEAAVHANTQVKDGITNNVEQQSREENAATVQVDDNNFDDLMEFVLRSMEDEEKTSKSIGEQKNAKTVKKELFEEKKIKDNKAKGISCADGCGNNVLKKKETKLVKKSHNDMIKKRKESDEDKEIRELLDTILSQESNKKRESLSTLIESILENFSTK